MHPTDSPYLQNIAPFLFPPRRLTFVGGKGGVGKTTVSLALGQHLAERAQTLVISTDPAHSLAHALARPTERFDAPTSTAPNLYVQQVNAAQLFEDFRRTHRNDLFQLFDSSSYLDEDDFGQLFSLTLPGLDELMAFKAIADLLDDAQWANIVVDTAPTGHALRLLNVPDLLDTWVKALAKLRWKYRVVQATFRGKQHPDEPDDILLAVKRLLNHVRDTLHDRTLSEVWVVCKAERMVLDETYQLLASLKAQGLTVENLLVNDVMPLHFEGEFCQRRRAQQTGYLQEVIAHYPSLRLHLAESTPEEVVGWEKIGQFRQAMRTKR